MVKRSPDLSRNIRKRKTDLYFSLTMSKFQALGKDSGTLDGLNSYLIIVDELHGIKDRGLYEVMQQSQSARRQPLLIMITTADTVRECIFDDMYAYACNVVDGKFKDENFLPILYELDSREEWRDPSAWATAWLSFDDINNEETFNITDFKNRYAIGGADLSITTDLTCATLLMMDKDTQKRYIHQMYWIPADNLDMRVRQDRIPYDIWHSQGLLRLCNGNSINYGDITAWFLEMVNDYGITPLWIYCDSYSAKYWVEEMETYGFKMERCIQGAKTLSLPMQQLGADLQAKKIHYNNNPILKWCLTNTGIQTDRNGNIVPIKNQSAKQRIDGTASMLDAYVGLMEHYQEFLMTLRRW